MASPSSRYSTIRVACGSIDATRAGTPPTGRRQVSRRDDEAGRPRRLLGGEADHAEAIIARAASSRWPTISRFEPLCRRKATEVGSLIATASPSQPASSRGYRPVRCGQQATEQAVAGDVGRSVPLKHDERSRSTVVSSALPLTRSSSSSGDRRPARRLEGAVAGHQTAGGRCRCFAGRVSSRAAASRHRGSA
jgi:hypothetical protein